MGIRFTQYNSTMTNDTIDKLEYALAFKRITLQKPVKKVTVHDIEAETTVPQRRFYECFADQYELIVWYCNYAGEQLVRHNIKKDWSEIANLIINDISTYSAFYRPLFDAEERPDLIYPLYDFTFRFMKMYAELRGNTLTDNDLFLLDFITAGSIYVVKTWLLDTDCAMNTGPLTTKLVSAYPVVMKGIFK